MESIGTLAGGIAHDFNNILGIIIGCSELTMLNLQEDSKNYQLMQQVLKAAQRATDLVQQILTFSRKEELTKGPLRLGPIMKETIKMLRASLPSTITIRQQIDKESDWTLADPAQIHQIIMNLCTNAAHAMRENGGVLSLSLYKIEIDADSADNVAELSYGPFLKLSI